MSVEVQRPVKLHDGTAGVLERLAACRELDRKPEMGPVVRATRAGRIALHAIGQRYRVAGYEQVAPVQDEVADHELGEIVRIGRLRTVSGKPDVIAVLRMPVRRHSDAGPVTVGAPQCIAAIAGPRAGLRRGDAGEWRATGCDDQRGENESVHRGTSCAAGWTVSDGKTGSLEGCSIRMTAALDVLCHQERRIARRCDMLQQVRGRPPLVARQ
jgi:hypothetical protein